MFRTTAATVAATLTLMAGVALHAQTTTIPGQRRTETVTVEKVDVAGRKLTLRTASGELRTISVPPEATRLDEVKPGSRMAVTFQDNLIVRKKPKGEPAVDTAAEKVAPTTGSATPAGSSVAKQTMTVNVTAVDSLTRTISLSGPRGWRHQSQVRDPKVLEDIKVGDRLDLTWTEATMVSIVPPK